MSSIFVLLMIVFVCWLIIRPRRRGRTWTITEENPIGFGGFLFRLVIAIIGLCVIISLL